MRGFTRHADGKLKGYVLVDEPVNGGLRMYATNRAGQRGGGFGWTSAINDAYVHQCRGDAEADARHPDRQIPGMLQSFKVLKVVVRFEIEETWSA